ncbi:hypothetical protein [Hyalangium versicolor]|uniref:hypothetical protein n=1 Tax=Hyalangium versicolor TaxID=2861190 RepID=UPI001CCC0F67|nr:hypothetical protein [Hyalangium versicolor]
MLLKPFSVAVCLWAAVPAFAAGTASPSAKAASGASSSKAAPASAQPAGGQGGTCSACGAPGGGGTCAAPQPGQAPQLSNEEWKEYVRKKLLESEQEAPEPVDPDPFSFSVFKGRRPEPMGEQTLINGAKMQIATLIVEDSPQDVAQAYYETFVHMGFRPLLGDVPEAPGVRYLSFRPVSSKNLKTVTLVPNGSGTVILASVGNPEEMLVQKPALPGGLPVPPNSEAASAIQQMEPGSSSRSAFFVVNGSTPENVRAFYRSELPRLGFSPIGQSAQQDSESFEKEGVLLTISARPHTDPNTVAVSLVWLE